MASPSQTPQDNETHIAECEWTGGTHTHGMNIHIRTEQLTEGRDVVRVQPTAAEPEGSDPAHRLEVRG